MQATPSHPDIVAHTHTLRPTMQPVATPQVCALLRLRQAPHKTCVGRLWPHAPADRQPRRECGRLLTRSMGQLSAPATPWQHEPSPFFPASLWPHASADRHANHQSACACRQADRLCRPTRRAAGSQAATIAAWRLHHTSTNARRRCPNHQPTSTTNRPKQRRSERHAGRRAAIAWRGCCGVTQTCSRSLMVRVVG